MTIDIEKLIDDIDEDGSGLIEYDEFMSLLSSSDWAGIVNRDISQENKQVKGGCLDHSPPTISEVIMLVIYCP